MDSKVTTQAQLGELDERGIGFITLRARTPKLTAHLHALPASAWTNADRGPRRRHEPAASG